MKIVFIGDADYSHLGHLNKALKQSIPNLHTTVIGLFWTGNRITEKEELEFDAVLSLPLVSLKTAILKKPLGFIFLSLWTCIKHFFKQGPIQLKNSAKSILRSNAKKAQYTDFFKGLNADIINYHYCDVKNLGTVSYLPQGARVVLSFWGSDLWSVSTPAEYAVQHEVIERAEAITLHTIEMRQIFLSKFGFRHWNKCFLALYGMDKKRLNFLDTQAKNNDNEFSIFDKFSIPREKKIIVVGYSATPDHQHLLAVKSLESLSDQKREKIHLVFLMTYGDTEYTCQLEKALANCSLNHTIIKDFLSLKELASLIFHTKIFINIRLSDSMNSFMTEQLYMGNIVINGSWLPYAFLKRKGAKFWEVEDPRNLYVLVENMIENSYELKKQLEGNKHVIEDNLLVDHTSIAWIQLFNKLNYQ